MKCLYSITPGYLNRKTKNMSSPLRLTKLMLLDARTWRTSIVIELLWCGHAHPQLPLSLLRLQLQRLHGIAKPVLLCPQCLHPQFLLRADGLAPTPLCGPTCRSRTRSTIVVTSKSALVQIALGYKGLFTTFQFVQVILNALEEVVDFRADL